MSVPRFSRSVDAKGISHAWFDAFDEGVPDVETAVWAAVEINDTAWFQIVWLIENQQLHAGGTAAVKREIDTIALNRASEWMG